MFLHVSTGTKKVKIQQEKKRHDRKHSSMFYGSWCRSKYINYAGQSIVCKLIPANSIAFNMFCTLWPCDLNLWPLAFSPNIKWAVRTHDGLSLSKFVVSAVLVLSCGQTNTHRLGHLARGPWYGEGRCYYALVRTRDVACVFAGYIRRRATSKRYWIYAFVTSSQKFSVLAHCIRHVSSPYHIYDHGVKYTATTMILSSTRTSLHTLLACWVVLVVSLARIRPIASEKIADCREVSGYTSGPVLDTCTVQHTLDDKETDVISSLRAECKDFPFNCTYTLYAWNSSTRNNLMPRLHLIHIARIQAVFTCIHLYLLSPSTYCPA